MSDDIACSLLATAARVAEADVPADAAVGNWELWDSLTHMRLMLLIEERLGRMLSPEEILAVGTLGDLRFSLRLIDTRGGQD